MGQVYDKERDGKKIIPNVFYGKHFEDTLMFSDPSIAHDELPTLELDNFIFMSTTGAEFPFNT